LAIKWNANKVKEALDEVEQQINLAESFFAEAKKKAEEALRIPKLPEYMGNRLGRIVSLIERIDDVKSAIESARADIPANEIERWQKRESMGSTAPLFDPSKN
jgi:hypothetical protein